VFVEVSWWLYWWHGRVIVHQATSGRGGWPMSVFLTPDLEPITGGTYFPPADRWPQPGFRSVLLQVSQQVNSFLHILQWGSVGTVFLGHIWWRRVANECVAYPRAHASVWWYVLSSNWSLLWPAWLQNTSFHHCISGILSISQLDIHYVREHICLSFIVVVCFP